MSKRNEEYAKLLGELIKCKTIYSRGEYKSEFVKFRVILESMFKLLYKEAKLKIFGDGALLYKIEGQDKERNILIMSHHDVVDINGKWDFEPFSGEIKDGKLLGRGTVDTKTSFFAEIMAVEELLEESFIPKVNIYIASSNCEEVGGDGIPLIRDYFTKKNTSLELVLDEGGAIIDPPLPGLNDKVAMVAVHEKGRTVLNCIASDDDGHASFSNVESPVIRMSKFISEVSRKIFLRESFIQKLELCLKNLVRICHLKRK